MITTNVHSCVECGAENSVITDFNNGQIACTNCAIVLEDGLVDETSEWRNFSAENPGSGNVDHNRVGGPLNPYLDEVSLSTKIHTNSNRGPLAKFKNRAFESGSRSILRGMEKIEEIAIKLDLLMSIVAKSKDVYKTVIDNKKLKGRSLEGIIAAILYHVCRQDNANRPLSDFVTKLKLDKKEFVRCFNSIRELIASSNDSNVTENTIALTNRFCNNLEYDVKFRTIAKEITNEVCEKEIIAGRNPNTVAAACICYTFLLHNKTPDKKQLSSVSNIGENTITSALNVIIQHREEITPLKYQSLLLSSQLSNSL